MLREHTRRDPVDHVDEPEQRVARQVLLAELHLRNVARVGLAQHGVPVAGDDLTGVEGVPQRLLDVLFRRFGAAELLLELHDPAQHLLVREAVERARKAVDAGRKCVVGVRQRGGNEVGGVRRDVAGLVIGVQDEVHPRDVVVRLGDPHLVGEVAAEVELRIGDDLGVALVLQPVDHRRD